MRPKIIAGNWKMYTTPTEGKKLAEELISELKNIELKNNSVIVIPPYLHLQSIASLFAGIPGTSVGAQNCHYENEGAFTGEIRSEKKRSFFWNFSLFFQSGNVKRNWLYMGYSWSFRATKCSSVVLSSQNPAFKASA